MFCQPIGESKKVGDSQSESLSDNTAIPEEEIMGQDRDGTDDTGQLADDSSLYSSRDESGFIGMQCDIEWSSLKGSKNSNYLVIS